MAADGTPRALKPIAEAVLAFVARHRDGADMEETMVDSQLLRRIELCALTTLDVANFDTLYGGDHAPSA